ncbi:hypothetical protein WJX74_004617 [Apatococcus lobatus]|uniref:JmjC domain-containing protein n=1 Tax=Apatococcus lobatus TaxID=904363 RepID=A0AAW1QUY2_9CHLO
MEDCDRPQEKQCRLCGRCKPLDAFRRRSDSGSLRSECAACQNQDNAGRNKRARVAKAAVHGCETGPRSSTGSANNSCSWREADSSGLIEQDAQLHKLLFCGFRASAHSLDDASTKVLLLETESKQMQQVRQQIHEARDILQGAKGAFLVAFPKQGLTKEAKLHRLLEHSCGIETYPGRLSLGTRSEWVPQDSKAALPHLQMCDEDVARLRLNPEAALRCNAGRCSSQAATAWSLADEAMGRCLPKAYADFDAVELMEGISLAATIVSMAFTYTPAHVEDMLQGAVNDLVVGAWKVWYIVDPAKAATFKDLLSAKHGPHALQQLFEKRLRPILSAEEMRSSGIRIIFQPPGCMVVTLPGEVFHWTMSLGASIAESSNFFTTAGGMSLPGMCAEWRSHAQEAQSTHNRVAVAAQLEATLTSFGVLAPRTL